MIFTKKQAREQSKRIARFVRDQLEDLHSKEVPMTDQYMPDINRAIRKGIYEYMCVYATGDTDLICDIMVVKYYPKYWEDDCFDEVDKSVNKLLLNYKK